MFRIERCSCPYEGGNVRNGSRRDVIGQRVLGPCRSACESEKVEVEVQRGDQLCSKGIYECRLEIGSAVVKDTRAQSEKRR